MTRKDFEIIVDIALDVSRQMYMPAKKTEEFKKELLDKYIKELT